jgi:phosphoglycolate phosphatase
MNSAATHACRLFIFDLDGTLVDSRADITLSLNLMLARLNMQPLPESRVADFVGSGLQKLVERGLREVTGRDPESKLVEEGMAIFLEAYGDHLLDKTRLCYGVVEALDCLSWACFGVVTNKPERFSRRILEALGVATRFRIVLGGDSVQKRKPDPEALFTAMEYCNASPPQTAMIGDSRLDIEAGKAAGVTTCGVLGGFRPREELEDAGCDLILNNLLELPKYFRKPQKHEG